jgi:DNA-directed DNA polymerase III PolC
MTGPVRAIVHLDADAFFASVEQSADARLRGKPIAVGGEKRGIIASASYEARRFGIYTPMPTSVARRLCPKLILLPGDFEKYELFSRLMFSYVYDFTPEVEIGSIDEGYFDLTGARKPAVGIAETIRRAIGQALKLPVSEGLASNKLVSQIASKLKKPSAFEYVAHGREAEFLSPLENKWLPGIGPKTAIQLNAAGLASIGQIAQTPAELLGLVLGRGAPQLRQFALGIDERPVVPMRTPAKSYGEQETFAEDTTDEAFLEATLRRMADQLMAKVRADGKSIRTVTVKVRYNDMDEEQAGESLAEPTDLETDLYGRTSALFRKAWQRRVSLRLVALKLSNVYDGRFSGGLALDVATRQHSAQQRVVDIVDDLRQKYGRSVLLRGHDFVLRRCAREAEEKPRPLRLRGEVRVPCKAAPRLRQPPAIPLNVHSYYSFLDSTLSVEAIVELAKRHELPAIALTDDHNLHGAIRFAQAAAEAGIKSIIGVTLNCEGRRLCLYVENEKGYHNLCRILTHDKGRRTEGDGPRSAFESMPLRTGMSALRQGRTAPEDDRPRSNFESGSLGLAADSDFRFQISDFGLAATEGLLAVGADPAAARHFPGRFYLEANSEEALEKRRAPLPCVAAFPVHYAAPADRWQYDIVQSIRTLTLLREAHPEKRLEGEYHFRTEAELRRLFAAHPELVAHSHEIAERCSFKFSLGKPQFPSYPPPDGSAPAAFLHRLVMAGLRRRYPKDHARLKPQLEEELAIITEVGYEEYFLVMWDILQECRRRGIEWITRGSAADSLACYCLEISSVCPIRFDLYFRRFLNKERMALNKLPDIDVDFPHDRKDDVIDLIFEKYGREHAAVVGGFSTFQARSAFAEVAKVLGVSEFQVRRLTERFPHFARSSELGEAAAGSQECRDLPLSEEPYATALKMGQFLDGFPRYPKMHPCGLVLSRRPMQEITPCFVSAKGYPTTHFDMDSVEAAGLVKMDILAQGGLAVMRDVKEMLENPKAEGRGPKEGRNPKGQPLDGATAEYSKNTDGGTAESETRHCGDSFSEFDLRASFGPRPSAFGFDLALLEPWEDRKVWELIASGSARAVHHIESPAMISLCKMCAVHDIDTLIAIVSVIRPGAANESKKMEFARRYQGLSPVRYPHPSLERCLRSTYGLVVYEEHILQICEAFAGLPAGRADVLRRALAKEKRATIAQIQSEFTECARRRGRTEAEISEVWPLVAGFHGYAFCKAHSTAYGVEAYQSAWLKRYHPSEFMAAVLTNGKGFYRPLVYILECHRLGIPLLPPSVNQPGPQFAVNHQTIRKAHPHDGSGNGNSGQAMSGSIRVPVVQVKGLTNRTKDAILDERERGRFVSLEDFFVRVQPLPEEMESLIRIGAFDEFREARTTQYWKFKSWESTARCPRRQPGQLWLLPPGNLDRLGSVPLAEPNRLERLRAEEELLGYAVSGHPLELFPEIAWETYCPINRLGEHLGEQIVTCGLVIEQRLFHQITGEPMKFLTIADRTGMIETELFARTYRSYGLNTVRYRVLEIVAVVEPFESGRGHTLRVLRAGKPRQRGCATARATGRRRGLNR